MSAITPKTEQLLAIFDRTRRAKETSGASMFGPDLSRWPVWAVDAQDIIAVCELRESNARAEAEMMELGAR